MKTYKLDIVWSFNGQSGEFSTNVKAKSERDARFSYITTIGGDSMGRYEQIVNVTEIN